ncbi:hypothetical protein CSP48_004015 [Salmonella enterica subsp. arizonae]|nr:hypothetical protein [Salmonella enterica subsp. arizonae]
MQDLSLTDKLRKAAKALADGSESEVIIPLGLLSQELAGKKSSENPASYVRTIMSRVPEVKEFGSIRVKKTVCDDGESNMFGMEIYRITLSSERRKTVYGKADVERHKRKAVNKAAEKFMMLSPNLANYTPEEYATVAKVMQELNALIKLNFINEGE